MIQKYVQRYLRQVTHNYSFIFVLRKLYIFDFFFTYLWYMKEFNHPFLRQASSGFPGCSDGKKSPCNAGSTWVQSLGQDDPWRRAQQPNPQFLPGESHGQREEPGGLQSMGLQQVGHNWVINTFTKESTAYLIFFHICDTWIYPVSDSLINLILNG